MQFLLRYSVGLKSVTLYPIFRRYFRKARGSVCTNVWVVCKENNRERVGLMTSLGLIFIIIPFALFFFNPTLMLANYQLRLANGTLLHNVIQHEIEGVKIHFYLYNVTNADTFMAGGEAVLKIKEIGPFVYQEYRTNEDLELNVEPGIMRYTPSHRTELILEESVGKPEDFDLVLPNIALLAAVHIVSKYPFFIGQLFKMLTTTLNRKAFTKVNAHTYFWGNTDPILKVLNTVVPGLIYYNSTGLITRFYDLDAKYRVTVSTSDLEKFQVKSVQRLMINKNKNVKTISESINTYNNTYEGAAFPSLTPGTPIHIYRHSVCRDMKLIYSGTKKMEYGSDAYVYKNDESKLKERTVCNSKGWCPDGVLDLSPCYYGFPFAMTKGHFLDADPKVYEKIQGLKPNRSLHDPTLIIDPNIGVTVEATMSMQLNLALGDMSLFPETKQLSDMFIPITQTLLKHPKMREETKSMLRLLYTYGPYTVVSMQVVLFLIGVALLACSVKMYRFNKSAGLSNQKSLISHTPLLK